MVKSVDIAADGAVKVAVYLTVSGCPMRDTITRDVTDAVAKVDGVTGVDVDLDVMSDEQRQELATSLRGGTAEREVPVRQAGLADPGLRGGVRQGRCRQVLGDGQPGRGDGRRRPEGRCRRRRHLRPLACRACWAPTAVPPRSRT